MGIRAPPGGGLGGGAGVRPVCSAEAAGELLHKLSELEVDPTLNWNRRYRENMDRLRSGDLLEVAGVVKALTLRDRRRGLSTGEKRMLSLSKQILTSELALALDREPAEMTREVIDLLCPRGRRAKKRRRPRRRRKMIQSKTFQEL